MRHTYSDGVLETGADGRALQNVLICVEMIIAAPFMLKASGARYWDGH